MAGFKVGERVHFAHGRTRTLYTIKRARYDFLELEELPGEFAAHLFTREGAPKKSACDARIRELEAELAAQKADFATLLADYEKLYDDRKGEP